MDRRADPADLIDRRVEITGPVDRKMVINALNSGASVFMADFEDSNSPTWTNNLEGQINLRDAIGGTITYTSPEGKELQAQRTRPRRCWCARAAGTWWRSISSVDGKPISGSLFDFGLFFFHNAKALIAQRHGALFLPAEAGEPPGGAPVERRLRVRRRTTLGIPRGTIRATVLIETILAAFEMDEILYELREHSAGLNCGRWDYIFSFIKKFRNHPGLRAAGPRRGHHDAAIS